MQPAMPLRGDLRGLGQALVDHPAARHTERPDPLLLHIIVVAGVIAADQLAAQRGVDPVRPGVPAPPAEDLAQNAHAVRLAAPRPRVPTLMALPTCPCPCAVLAAELPQPLESGIALGWPEPVWRRFFAIPTPLQRHPGTPKSPPLQNLRGLRPRVPPKSAVALHLVDGCDLHY